MKIVFVATLPLSSATLIGRTIPIAQQLAARGHTVTVLTLGEKNEDTTTEGVHLRVVGPHGGGGTGKRPSFFSASQRILRGLTALSKGLKTEKPERVVLVKAHPQNTFAVQHISCPLLLDADDDERYASRLSFVERLLLSYCEKQAARMASSVVVCSPELQRHYTNDLHAKQVAYIPTGISEHTASIAPDLRAHFSLPPRTPLLLYIGSIALSSGHRIDDLLIAWEHCHSRLPSAHLVFVGTGIHEEDMKAHASRSAAADRIHWYGRYAADDAEGFASQATLLVDPVDSSRAANAKSSSRVLLALKIGTPIVAGNSGIRKKFLPPPMSAYTLYVPGDTADFAEKIVAGMSEETRARFQDETAGQWKQWSWGVLGDAYARVLEHGGTA